VLGILFNVKPTGDWLAVRFNDTESNIGSGIPQWNSPQPLKFSDRAKPIALDRASCMSSAFREGANLKAFVDETWRSNTR